MDGTLGRSVRRARPAALLGALLCIIALLAPSAARGTTGHARSHVHIAAIFEVGFSYQHLPALRLDHPQLLGAVACTQHLPAFGTATATSSKIAIAATVDSPRMRGPPADGCF
jgi:hypothetical protein